MVDSGLKKVKIIAMREASSQESVPVNIDSWKKKFN